MAQTKQLSDSAMAGMAQLGIDTTGVMVTADQASQIQNVLSSSDPDAVRVKRIQAILGNEATATGRLGTDQLRDSVSADMAALGLDTEMVPMLQVDQLAAIENVTGTGASTTDDQKRAQIETIIGGNAPGAGAMGANNDATMADIANLGIDTSTIGTLSADQMTQIKTVMSGSDTDQDKRKQVEAIIGQ